MKQSTHSTSTLFVQIWSFFVNEAVGVMWSSQAAAPAWPLASQSSKMNLIRRKKTREVNKMWKNSWKETTRRIKVITSEKAWCFSLMRISKCILGYSWHVWTHWNRFRKSWCLISMFIVGATKKSTRSFFRCEHSKAAKVQQTCNENSLPSLMILVTPHGPAPFRTSHLSQPRYCGTCVDFLKLIQKRDVVMMTWYTSSLHRIHHVNATETWRQVQPSCPQPVSPSMTTTGESCT